MELFTRANDFILFYGKLYFKYAFDLGLFEWFLLELFLVFLNSKILRYPPCDELFN